MQFGGSWRGTENTGVNYWSSVAMVGSNLLVSKVDSVFVISAGGVLDMFVKVTVCIELMVLVNKNMQNWENDTGDGVVDLEPVKVRGLLL